MQLSRRQFLAALSSLPLLGGLGTIYMRLFEPDWFEVTEKNVAIGRFNQPLRILHLSDLHASESVSYKTIERAIDLSLEQKPDIAFLTGDFITWDLSGVDEYRRILKKLSDKMPTFACIGNHDGGKWAGLSHGYKDFSRIQNLLESSGVRFLFNEQERVTIHGQSIWVAGLGDLWSDDLKPEKVLQAKRTDNAPIFVLSHNPDSKTILRDYDWDLMCCGHTHGGQLVVPLIDWRPFIPVHDKSFPEGILSWGRRHIHITRGVGNLHGMRLNCRPEVSVLNVV